MNQNYVLSAKNLSKIYKKNLHNTKMKKIYLLFMLILY